MLYLVLYIITALIDRFLGKFEGYYYHFKFEGLRKDLFPDEHSFFLTLRASIYSLAGIALILDLYHNWSWLYFGWVVLMFLSYCLKNPYWHNGVMYEKRNELWRLADDPSNLNIPYPNGWKDDKDGEAKNDFTWIQRKVMVIASVVIFIGLVIIKVFTGIV